MIYSEVSAPVRGEVKAVCRLSVAASEAGGGGVFQIRAGEDDVHRGLKAALLLTPLMEAQTFLIKLLHPSVSERVITEYW